MRSRRSCCAEALFFVITGHHRDDADVRCAGRTSSGGDASGLGLLAPASAAWSLLRAAAARMVDSPSAWKRDRGGGRGPATLGRIWSAPRNWLRAAHQLLRFFRVFVARSSSGDAAGNLSVHHQLTPTCCFHISAVTINNSRARRDRENRRIWHRPRIWRLWLCRTARTASAMRYRGAGPSAGRY